MHRLGKLIFLSLGLILCAMPTKVQAACPTDPTAGDTNVGATPNAWWPMNEGSGTTVTDCSNNGDTGTLAGSPTWTTGLLYNSNALSFNGTSAYISTSNSSLIQTGPLTVCAWINPGTASFTNNYNPAIIGNSAFILSVNSNSGSLGVYNNGVSAASSLAGSIVAGQWYHACVTRDSSGDTNIYINGNLSGQANQTVTGAPTSSPWGVYIGTYLDKSGFYSGTIEDLRVYSQVLSGTQINYIHQDEANTIPLVPPGSLTLNLISSSQIDLSWPTSVSPAAVGYNIYRSVNGGAYSQINTSLVTTTSYNDTDGLQPTTSYAYEVYAVNSKNVQSSTAATASTNTGAAPPSTITAKTCGQSDVQTAINNVAAGGTVYIPAGNCGWSDANGAAMVLIQGKGVNLVGAGSSRIIAISTDTLALATGTLTLHVTGADPGTTLSIPANETLTISETGDPANFMAGTVTSYSGGVLTMNITSCRHLRDKPLSTRFPSIRYPIKLCTLAYCYSGSDNHCQ